MNSRPGSFPSLAERGVTRREFDVLQLLSQRLSNREVAERLVVSVRTVESHVSSLLTKLGAANRRELANMAPDLVAGASEVPVVLRSVVARTSFVGRRRELDRLAELWRTVASGAGPRVAIVRGEAGVGKTRLLAELAHVVSHPSRVWYGRCDRDDARPYRPFLGANEAVAGALRSVSTDSERYRAFDTVAQIVRHSSPLLFVVDDVQWADGATTLLLRDLALSSEPVPLLLGMTCRDEQPPPPLVLGLQVDLRRLGLLDEWDLGPLPVDDARRVVEGHVGVADEKTVASLVERAGGNPFLLHELADHVRRGRSPDDVPPGVREVVNHRLAGLGDETMLLVRAAAVAGRRTTLAVLATATGLDSDVAVERLGPAVAARLVADAGEGAYEFTHDLVQESVYGSLPVTLRQRMHTRIADALETTASEDWPDIARHRWAAGTPSAAAAEAAGRFLGERLAYDHAARFFAMAVEALDQDDHAARARLHLAEGDARRRAGDATGALRSYEAARQEARLGHTPHFEVDAALGTAAAKPVYSLDDDLVGLLEDALAIVGDDEGRRSRVLAALALARYYTAPLEERRLLSAQAIEHAQRAGDERTLGDVLVMRRAALLGDPDALSDRIDAATAIVELGQRLSDRELAIEGYALLVVDRLEDGDIAQFQAAASAHAALAAELRQPVHLCDAIMWRGAWATVAGDEVAARTAIEELRARGRQIGDEAVVATAVCQDAWLAHLTGEGRALKAAIPEMAGLAAERSHVAALQFGFAAFLARAGDLDRAREVLDSNLPSGVDRLRRDIEYLLTLSELAELAAALDDQELGSQLVAPVARYADRFVLVDRALGCKGLLIHELGLLKILLGDRDDGVRCLEQAAVAHEAMGAAALAARSRRALATSAVPA